MPDTPHLPLNSLRAFEASVRLGSMTAASRELRVTPGAVSRHIKALEARFGLPLLERLPRAVIATREGAQLAGELSAAFDQMRLAVSRIQPGPLILSCSATIMMHWLLPRLGRFKRDNPTVELRLNVSFGNLDFVRDEIGVAIRNSMYRPPPTAAARTLVREEIGPVCHPNYASRLGLAAPQDLARARLLATETRPQAWEEWARSIGESGRPLQAHEVYEHFYLAIQAAACNLGVAVAPRILVEDEIAEGRLVAPFGFVSGPNSLRLWIARHVRDRADVRSLSNWLQAEMKGHRRCKSASARCAQLFVPDTTCGVVGLRCSNIHWLHHVRGRDHGPNFGKRVSLGHELINWLAPTRRVVIQGRLEVPP